MTRIEFRQGDGATSTSVPGELLPLQLPEGVRHQGRTGATAADVVLATKDDAPYAGRLSLPYVGSEGRVEVAYLDVPPPAPWTSADLRVMWMSSAALLQDKLRRGGVGGAPWGQADWLTDPERLAWERFDRCRAAAAALLARWPTEDDEEIVWAPLDVPFGQELSVVTDQGIGVHAHPVDIPGRGTLPDRTARRIVTTRPQRSSAIMGVASLLSELSRKLAADSSVGELPPQLLAPITSVRRHAAPAHRAPDPPPSSWPLGFRRFYASALAAISHIVSAGLSGKDWVPLSDVWWLYETWVTERILECLTRLLGNPQPVVGGAASTLLARWAPAADEEVELHRQLSFPTGSTVDLLGVGWRSVTSQLQPDIVLVVRKGSDVRLVVVDPKEWTALTAKDVTSEASKYLWGIRRGSNPSASGAVERVVLISPFAGPDAADMRHGRAAALHAAPFGHPNQPIGELGQDLSTDVVKEWLQLARTP